MLSPLDDTVVCACRSISLVSLEHNRFLGGELFVQLATDPENLGFDPHPLTAEYALRMSWNKDVYLLALVHGDRRAPFAAAYGILRGWDAGCPIPSLSIAVGPAMRSIGLGRSMVQHLHCMARARLAQAVRVCVAPENAIALELYTSMGYEWLPGLDNGKRVGILRFRGGTLRGHPAAGGVPQPTI